MSNVYIFDFPSFFVVFLISVIHFDNIMFIERNYFVNVIQR